MASTDNGNTPPVFAGGFSRFADLPPEIRAMIWREALPLDLKDPPTLFPYQPGCWQPRHLLSSDPDYLANYGPDHNIDFGFHHYLLRPVQVEIPLYFVNHEARSTALDWIRHHCIESWTYQGCTVFSRWFHKERDILYIPEDNLHEFLAEPMERPFEPDLVEKTLSVGFDNSTKIAMPASVLFSIPAIFTDMLPNYIVEVLLLVVGEQPSKWSLIDGKVARRFELEEHSSGQALVWEAKSGGFAIGPGVDFVTEDLRRLTQDHGEDLCNQLSNEHVRTFRVQPLQLKQ